MSTKTALKKAWNRVGKKALGRELGVAYQTMNGWSLRNEMPATEYNGKTFYSLWIQILTDGQVTIEQLLGFIPPPMVDEARRLAETRDLPGLPEDYGL